MNAHAADGPSDRLRPDARRDGYLPIEQYGVIGDCRSAALVGVDGAIDWCCLPRFDSSSIFARLLDASRGGAWDLAPDEEFVSRQQYGDKSNILHTRFRTATGFAETTDFMPVSESELGHHATPHEHPRIVRIVTGLSGSVRFRQCVDIRPGYARVVLPLISDGNRLHADHETMHYCITGSIPLPGRVQHFTVHPGESVLLSLCVNESGCCGRDMTQPGQGTELLHATRDYWWRWINTCTYRGPYQWHVWRSALALKMLTYAPTGAIIAAPTTSLPEWIGGSRNWDYRYTWLRDASFTVYALFQLGFTGEATDFMNWISRLAVDRGVKNLYDLDGHAPREERELAHLRGYRESRPVRVENGAANQLQLDVFGELLDAVYVYSQHGGEISQRLWTAIRHVINLAVDRWEEPDASLWEVRGQSLPFTYSKVMCWVAIDRGMRLARRHGFPIEAAWRETALRIRRAVIRYGYSETLGSFTQSFGSDRLDASALRLVQLGFLRPSDPRLRSTIEAVDRELSDGPLVYRYRIEQTDDGLEDPEGSFMICGFWLADSLALIGQLEEAERRFERLLAYASPLGLYSEEVNASNGHMLGNYPQAFSHLSLISAAVNIERRRSHTLRR